ncbi:hypothetical protein CCYA_CCYA11G3091 [Cyanidiococcus yangmingshanensis]|nr:hypothetical protein CCYA_CCYA11G3091 [Cyanidiococcus yangmingshanensis]
MQKEVRRFSPFFAPTPCIQFVQRPPTCGLHTRTRPPGCFRRGARAPAEQHPTTLGSNAGRARRCRNLNAPLKLQATLIEVIPLASSLNEATSEFLRNLVWLDFKLAVPLFVIAPLGLFFGSFTGGNTHDALRRVMVGYWQASSMLMLTVFLHIAEQPIGFFSALFVQIMIPLSLFWWKDLDAEIREAATQGSILERLFLFWRPLATALAGFGAFTQLSTLRCVGLTSEELLGDPQCAAWLEPPFEFYDLHVGVLLNGLVPREAFGIFAYSGLFLYLGYLVYMVAEVLPRVGRRGRVSRKGLFTSVRLLSAWGWIQDNDDET